MECADRILRRGAPDADLKRHVHKPRKSGWRITKRIAKPPVAHKRAVLLHALLATGEAYGPLHNAH